MVGRGQRRNTAGPLVAERNRFFAVVRATASSVLGTEEGNRDALQSCYRNRLSSIDPKTVA